MHRLDLFPEKDLIYQYRQVFSTRNGRDVLVHMLFDLGTFQETKGSEEETLRNYGLRLLNILSGEEPNQASIDSFIIKLMKQPIKEKKE